MFLCEILCLDWKNRGVYGSIEQNRSKNGRHARTDAFPENMEENKMEQYKKEFIEFMVESQVLKFGEFTLKSGRKSRSL